MAISFTRTFANLTSALLSYLDDNFNDINTWITSFFGTATGAQTTPAANKIPIANASGVLSGWGRVLVSAANNTNIPQGTTAFLPLFGTYSNTGSGLSQSIMPCSGVIKNLYAQAYNTNSLSGSLVITLTKNGSNTSVTTTITAGATTLFSDLVNSVSFVAGDRIGLKCVAAAGTGLVDMLLIGAIIEGV